MFTPCRCRIDHEYSLVGGVDRRASVQSVFFPSSFLPIFFCRVAIVWPSNHVACSCARILGYVPVASIQKYKADLEAYRHRQELTRRLANGVVTRGDDRIDAEDDREETAQKLASRYLDSLGGNDDGSLFLNTAAISESPLRSSDDGGSAKNSNGGRGGLSNDELAILEQALLSPSSSSSSSDQVADIATGGRAKRDGGPPRGVTCQRCHSLKYQNAVLPLAIPDGQFRARYFRV